MDAQYKWEMTALNALEQAAIAQCQIAVSISEALAAGKLPDINEVLKLVRESQIRLARDIRELRKLTGERFEEQP